MKWFLGLCIAMCNLHICSRVASTAAALPVETLVHTSSAFSLTVNAPMRDAAPLFGPEGERAWAGPEWDPQFVFPSPAKDVEGAVFMVRHGNHTAVWINTVFDLETGRFRYIYVLADLLATTIDVRLHSIDTQHTRADVTYTRTALRPEGNEHVRAMAERDSRQGPEWQASINRYLQHRKTSAGRE